MFWCESVIMGMIQILMRLTSAQLEEVIKNEAYYFKLRNDWRNSDRCIDIDKSWHAIHYLLTESDWGGGYPARHVIFGDAQIEKIDGGWGPATFLEPDQVVEVNEFLSNVTVEDIKECYDPKSLDSANIYPDTWLRDKEDALEWILHFFIQVQKLYKDAAKAGECVLMIIF